MIDSLDLTQFKQISFIGNGSFGEVYKVEDKKSGEILAAKISLRFLSESTDQSFRDLKREVSILSRTCHPSIVRFIGFSPCNFHGEEKPVIITEYLMNGSLYDVLSLEKKGLSNKEWNDTRKLICIYGIASAMSYLHANGIIHRDLKPANILMDDFLFPRIADFGLSKMKHQNQESMTADSTTMIKGTALYIAPEIWMSMEYSPACDVYSFAIIVFEIMTCEEPWKNLNLIQIHNKVESGFRPEIKNVPDSYQQLIEKCWAQDPQERPTFNEILDELQNNDDFITDLVEKDDFLDYIDYISSCKTTFSKNPIRIDQYIKRSSATFTKVTLNLNKNSSSSSNIKVSETVKVSDSKEKNKSKRFSLFKKHKSKMLYPLQEFHNLNISNQQMVEDSVGDPDKEFIIGQNLIEGKEDFPQNTEIGILYLDHSVKHGSLDGTIYYCRLLIKGKDIPPDIEKVSKLLKKFKKSNNGSILALHGKMKKKKGEYLKAIKYFEKSSKLGNAEGMYEYGKMLNKGLGCSENKKEARRYFEMAKKNGFNKSDKYLDSQGYFKKIADQGGAEELYQYATMLYDGKEMPEDKNEAFEYYKKAGDKGHIKSILRCASMLEKGEGVTQNKKEACQTYKKAADKGNSDAMLKYAIMIDKGNGVTKNKKEAVEYYKKAADKENVEALYRYGLLLEYGEGVKEDKKKALYYYKKGAEKGNVECMGYYARLYRNCRLFDDDRKFAIQCAKKAAEKSNPYGLCEYALFIEKGDIPGLDKLDAPAYMKQAADQGLPEAMLFYGEHIKKELVPSATKDEMENYFKKAIPLFRKEINEGHANAMGSYSYMLFYGYGVPENKKESHKYVKMAAEKGDIVAISNYGIDLFYGHGVEQNKKEGIRYIKMAAEKGYTFAMNKYAYILFDGDGIEANKKEAIRWYKKSADRGYLDAMHNYACKLYDGDGIDTDKKEAARYFKMAADKGDEVSMFSYGICLLNGEGVTMDKSGAYRYLKKAAERGQADSMRVYAYALRDGDVIPQDKSCAYQYFKKAADKGDTESMWVYAKALNDGTDIPANAKEAEHYFKMAIDKEDIEAMYQYGIILHNNQHNSNPKNTEAFRYFKKAAEKGHAGSMFNVAVMLYNGWGVPINKKEAFKYAKMSADKGDANGIDACAFMLENGEGTPKDTKEAARYRKMQENK